MDKWGGVKKELNLLNTEEPPYSKEFIDKLNKFKIGKTTLVNINCGYFKNVWNLKTERHNNRLYTTRKPIALIERIIKASSNEDDLVADFYGGSFTTAVSSHNLNRNFISCDISEKAVEIGKKRINELNIKLF